MDASQIGDRVDRAVTAAIPITASLGGLSPENYLQIMEFGKTMATCRAGVPVWLRGSIGDCTMIVTRALGWGLDPYFVAEQSYMMQNRTTGETTVGYKSQLLHAIIERRAPLKGRLRYRIEGAGDDRVCTVWGTFKGETEPHPFTSETLGKRLKDIGKSERGNFRGSPLWLQKPEVQLFYDASRDWGRINCPDVLGGVYSVEEMQEMEMVDVTPALTKAQEFTQRLKDNKIKGMTKGFDAERVARDVALSSITEGDAQKEVTDDDQRSGDEPIADAGRQDSAVDLGDGDRDQGGGGELGEPDRDVVGEPAGQEGAAEGEAEEDRVFPPDRITTGKPETGKPPKTRR